MAKVDYFYERDKANKEKIDEKLQELPFFCSSFILSMDSSSSSLTRLGYINDLRIFFDFISKFKFNISPKEISYSHIEKITSLDIMSFMSYLSYYTFNGKNYKNNEKGKARKLASIRNLFKFLFNNDLIKSDVASKVTSPKIHDKEIIRLTGKEVQNIVNQAENPNNLSKHQQTYLKNTSARDVAILTLFLGTGIRVSELVGLDVQDINFENSTFRITRKGGNQTVLYFSQEVKFALENWLEARRLKNLPKNENALFISLQNKRISVRAVENLVKKYAKAINPLKNISPHKLRSTYGTNLYHATQDIYVVADVLGHRDINTTKKHYAAMSDDLRKQASSMVKIRIDEDI